MADMRESSKRSIGQLTVDIDCSDALKGLKAITREARKATESLKALEEQQRKMSGQHVHRVDDSIPHSQQIDTGIVIDGINDKLTLAARKHGIKYY